MNIGSEKNITLDELLNKYTQACIELNNIEVNIKNEITKLRNETKQQIIDAPSNKDKESIFNEFRNKTMKIAENKIKYQDLKKKRDSYYNKISKHCIIDIDKPVKIIFNKPIIENNIQNTYHDELDKLTNKYDINNNNNNNNNNSVFRSKK